MVNDTLPYQLVGPEEAANILGVSSGTLSVWRCTKRYGLPYIKVGARVMYRLVDLQEFIERRTRPGEAREG